jgi:hypothetical protein
VCAAVSWAAASIQVLDKFFDHPFVRSGDRFAFPTRPMDKMLGGSNVSASRYLGIARVAQLLSKSFK